jgi:hypothetical protein
LVGDGRCGEIGDWRFERLGWVGRRHMRSIGVGWGIWWGSGMGSEPGGGGLHL